MVTASDDQDLKEVAMDILTPRFQGQSEQSAEGCQVLALDFHSFVTKDNCTGPPLLARILIKLTS